MPRPKQKGCRTGKPVGRKNELTRAKRILRAHLPALRERYAVTLLGVFGTYLRSAQKKGSDLPRNLTPRLY